MERRVKLILELLEIIDKQTASNIMSLETTILGNN